MTQHEIVAAVDRLGDAFATGDPDVVLAEFVADDAVLYAGSESGEIAVGRTALRTLLGQLFDRDERYRWRCDPPQVINTGHGLFVVADATLTVHAPSRHEPSAAWPVQESLPYRISGLLEQHDRQWRWRCCHGSEPTPAA